MDERTQLQRLAQEVEVLRKRLDEINLRIEQVDAVLAEHTITEAVLNALAARDDGSSISTHLPIGSGICLPYVHEGEEEGTALVDLGSGIFGERPWSDAKTITEERRTDIQRLRDELKQQSDITESTLGEAAQTFNKLAEQLNKAKPQPSAVPQRAEQPAEQPEEPQPARRGRKRGSMFGGDLTLDD